MEPIPLQKQVIRGELKRVFPQRSENMQNLRPESPGYTSGPPFSESLPALDEGLQIAFEEATRPQSRAPVNKFPPRVATDVRAWDMHGSLGTLCRQSVTSQFSVSQRALSRRSALQEINMTYQTLRYQSEMRYCYHCYHHCYYYYYYYY